MARENACVGLCAGSTASDRSGAVGCVARRVDGGVAHGAGSAVSIGLALFSTRAPLAAMSAVAPRSLSMMIVTFAIPILAFAIPILALFA